MSKDYYKILGIPKTADSATIKKAYHALALKYHPDKNPNDKLAEDKFKEISEANEVLSDPGKKHNHDTFGTIDPNQTFSQTDDVFEHAFRRTGPGSLRDIFAQFGVDFGRQTQKNSDIMSVMSISLADAFNGKNVPFEITMPDGGTNKLRVSIPAGVDNGSRIRLKGQGPKQNTNLPSGDLYITIQIAEHPTFKRVGADLFITKSISIIDAALGKVIEIPKIEGGIVKVQIPAGVQSDQKIRLKRKGMSRVGTKNRGDLYLIMKVIVPTNLTDKQKEILKSFDEESKKAT